MRPPTTAHPGQRAHRKSAAQPAGTSTNIATIARSEPSIGQSIARRCTGRLEPVAQLPLPYSRRLHLGCEASGMSESNMVDDDLDLHPASDSLETAHPIGQGAQSAAEIAHGAEGGLDCCAPTVQRSTEERAGFQQFDASKTMRTVAAMPQPGFGFLSSSCANDTATAVATCAQVDRATPQPRVSAGVETSSTRRESTIDVPTTAKASPPHCTKR